VTMREFEPKVFFALKGETDPIISDLLVNNDPVWNVLNRLKDAIRGHIKPNIPEFIQPFVPTQAPVVILPNGWLTDGYELNIGKKGKIEIWIDGELIEEASFISAGVTFADRDIEIRGGVVIESGAFVKGPTIVAERTEVRQGAYIRGDCYFGRGCVVGHTTEVKHSIFLDGAKAGHFAYIGDSILGNCVNLGAGTKLANLRLDGKNVVLKCGADRVDTNRRKLGAILGDSVQTGCNSVTNPGTILGMNSMVAPNATVLPGVYPEKTVIIGCL